MVLTITATIFQPVCSNPSDHSSCIQYNIVLLIKFHGGETEFLAYGSHIPRSTSCLQDFISLFWTVISAFDRGQSGKGYVFSGEVKEQLEGEIRHSSNNKYLAKSTYPPKSWYLTCAVRKQKITIKSVLCIIFTSYQACMDSKE